MDATGTSTTTMPRGWTAGGFVMVVTGPSGAGKGTLVEQLMESRPDCRFSVSATTRAPRGHEQNGREYWFIDREEFLERRANGEFLESAEVHGQLYGTLRSEVEGKTASGHVVVLDIDVQGGAQLRATLPEAVTVFVAPPSIDELRRRLEGRGTEKREAIELRMRNALGEIPQYRHYQYLIVNDQLEDAVHRLIGIHDTERLRVSRLVPQL